MVYMHISGYWQGKKVDIDAEKVDIDAEKMDIDAEKMDIDVGKVDIQSKKVHIDVQKVDIESALSVKIREFSEKTAGHIQRFCYGQNVCNSDYEQRS